MQTTLASPGGIGLDDAAYHTGHDHPGGVPALAKKLGMNPNTLQHKLDPRNSAHKLGLLEAQQIQALSGDFRILQAMAAANGFIALSLGSSANGTTLAEVMAMAKEFAEVLTAVHAAVADGRVTRNEMHECERQAAELFAAVNTMLRSLRGMMRPEPQA